MKTVTERLKKENSRIKLREGLKEAQKQGLTATPLRADKQQDPL